MKNSTRILQKIGLAYRARKLSLGEGLILEALKHTDQAIIFLASDAGKNIVKKITDKTKHKNIIVIDDFTTEELSNAVGKTNRKLLLLTDGGMIKSILDEIHPKKEVI